MNYYEIGQRIRKYRKAYGLSQDQLADKVGISLTHMSHIETGNTKLSLPVLVKLAETLSVQTDMLLFDSQKASKTELSTEITDLLDSCSIHDMYVLLDVMKATKISLDKYKKN